MPDPLPPERRATGKVAGYWEHATELERAVLKSDKARASRMLPRAVAAIREIWEPRTAENLGSILDARRARGEDVSWLEPIVTQLSKR